jgi:hypothetical protein
VEGQELSGAFGDTVRVLQPLEELVCESHAFRGFGCGQGLADGIGDVAGKDVRAVFILDVRED